jgi:UDP-N-acetylmuramate dehydrogenase
MNFLENFPLAARNTFHIEAAARFYAEPESEAELAALLRSVTARNLPRMVLGGGSNLVFSGDYPGLVIRYAGIGLQCYAEDSEHYYIEAGGGEPWHGFVRQCLARHWYGLENLSLIPGTVGASPIQNIGAYGVELTDVFHSLTAMDISSGELREFSHADCRFAYRESVFKQDCKDRYIITRVRFRLQKAPAVNTTYGDIQRELEARGITTAATPRQVSDAVIAIRSRKLPDPGKIGNAGSFFKNPVVPTAQFENIHVQFPGLVSYPQADGVKLAAGWLIEQAGWKGRRIGPVGTYEKQALVLVNHGGARGEDVMVVARAVQAAVQEKFGVLLEMEPRVY